MSPPSRELIFPIIPTPHECRINAGSGYFMISSLSGTGLNTESVLRAQLSAALPYNIIYKQVLLETDL